MIALWCRASPVHPNGPVLSITGWSEPVILNTGPLKSLPSITGSLQPLLSITGPLQPLLSITGSLQAVRLNTGPLESLLDWNGSLKNRSSNNEASFCEPNFD